MNDHQKLLNDIEQARVGSAEQKVVEGLRAKGLLDDEPPAPRAGEREASTWHKEYTHGRGYRINDSLGCVAEVREEALTDLIIAEHNQHATLVAQREQLVTALKDLIRQLPTDERLADFNLDLAESVLATIEQEGEAR